MLTGRYRRIYYYHLKKCGGSTLNQWLDTLTFDERVNDPAWIGAWLFGDPQVQVTPERVARDNAWGKSVFQWSDVIHSHAALRAYAPPRTFCFTVLRNPVERLISQVFDWRRLEAADAALQPPHVQACVRDSRDLPLRAFLERHAFDGGRMILNNFLTRALAAGRIGRIVLTVEDPRLLLESAIQSLEKDYDLVGLTEELDLSRNAFCALVGLPPAKPISRINRSRNAGEPDPEIAEAAELLQELTAVDQIVYEQAVRLFNQRYRDLGRHYADADFEAQHASALLSELRGRFDRHAARFSVRGPLIGSGFHGRDGAGTPECAVWTGPSCQTTLYFPVPAEMDLRAVLWIRGYAAPHLRDQLRVRVNGQPVAHRFVRSPGVADLLIAETASDRDFMRLDLEVDETLPYGTPHGGPFDPRMRGIAFDAFGWQRP